MHVSDPMAAGAEIANCDGAASVRVASVRGLMSANLISYASSLSSQGIVGLIYLGLSRLMASWTDWWEPHLAAGRAGLATLGPAEVRRVRANRGFATPKQRVAVLEQGQARQGPLNVICHPVGTEVQFVAGIVSTQQAHPDSLTRRRPQLSSFANSQSTHSTSKDVEARITPFPSTRFIRNLPPALPHPRRLTIKHLARTPALCSSFGTLALLACAISPLTCTSHEGTN